MNLEERVGCHSVPEASSLHEKVIQCGGLGVPCIYETTV
jgi:hypothetical protein